MQQVRIYGKFITYKNKRTCDDAAKVLFRVLPDKKKKRKQNNSIAVFFNILFRDTRTYLIVLQSY